MHAEGGQEDPEDSGKTKLFYLAAVVLRFILCIVLLEFFGVPAYASKEIRDSSSLSKLPDNPALTSLQAFPALAGRSLGHAVTLRHNGRWLNQIDNPKELSASYDVGLGKAKTILLGVDYSYQSYYKITWQSADLVAGAKVRFTPASILRFATGISYNYKNDSERYSTYGDMIDSRYGYVYSTNEIPLSIAKQFINLKAGIWFDYGKFFSGLTVYNIKQWSVGTQEDPSSFQPATQPLDMHFIAGYELNANPSYTLSPVLSIDKVKSIKIAITPAIYLNYLGRILLGISYANLNSLSITTGYTLKGRYALGARIDLPVKKDLQQISKVSYAEIGLKIIL